MAMADLIINQINVFDIMVVMTSLFCIIEMLLKLCIYRKKCMEFWRLLLLAPDSGHSRCHYL